MRRRAKPASSRAHAQLELGGADAPTPTHRSPRGGGWHTFPLPRHEPEDMNLLAGSFVKEAQQRLPPAKYTRLCSHLRSIATDERRAPSAHESARALLSRAPEALAVGTRGASLLCQYERIIGSSHQAMLVILRQPRVDMEGLGRAQLDRLPVIALLQRPHRRGEVSSLPDEMWCEAELLHAADAQRGSPCPLLGPPAPFADDGLATFTAARDRPADDECRTSVFDRRAAGPGSSRGAFVPPSARRAPSVVSASPSVRGWRAPPHGAHLTAGALRGALLRFRVVDARGAEVLAIAPATSDHLAPPKTDTHAPLHAAASALSEYAPVPGAAPAASPAARAGSAIASRAAEPAGATRGEASVRRVRRSVYHSLEGVDDDEGEWRGHRRRRREGGAWAQVASLVSAGLGSEVDDPKEGSLSLGGGCTDLLLEIFSHVDCALTLERASATCRMWHALLRRGAASPAASIWAAASLTVPVLGNDGAIVRTAADALRRAPAGSRVRLRAGTVVSEDVDVLQPLELIAEEGVSLRAKLTLRGGTLGAEGTLGEVRGLQLRHYHSDALLVHSGRWRLSGCDFASSKKDLRASTAITVRPAASLELDTCTVLDCRHAVCIERAPGRLSARRCTFINTKAVVITRGGGDVRVEESTFARNTTAFKLDDLVVGCATRNTLDGAVFGNWVKPAGFRCHGNNYLDGVEGSDDELEIDAIY